MSLLAPLISFDAITLDEMNSCLTAWDHKMGPLGRPDFGRGRYETCGLRRDEAFELTRLCAARPDLCRVVLRLWREFVFPALAAAWEQPWAISYQDRRLHSGDVYRFDGWLRLGETRSGPDQRAAGGPRKGRNKAVWGWTANAQLRADRKARLAAESADRAERLAA